MSKRISSVRLQSLLTLHKTVNGAILREVAPFFLLKFKKNKAQMQIFDIWQLEFSAFKEGFCF